MSEDMHILMESWRGYLGEQAGEPTVNDFLQAMAKHKPSVLKKVFGFTAKAVAGIAAGALIGATGGAAAGAAGLATAAGASAASAVGGALGTETVTQVMGKLADKAPALARWAYGMMRQGVPDESREPIDHYFDLDDELRALVTGGTGDSPLFQKFAKELAKKHQEAFAQIDQENDLDQPLANYLQGTASKYLTDWLQAGHLGPELKGIVIQHQKEA
tara:strand:- start:896 stop:1546 length:651 start_codon:yes stop_codon:yes gene_type:complete